MKIIESQISYQELMNEARQYFGDMIKAVVDIEKKIMAIGGEMQADEESLLLDNGSTQQNLWGINIKLNMPRDEWIEFDSMINIRPRQNNRSRNVDNPEIREKIIKIVNNLLI